MKTLEIQHPFELPSDDWFHLAPVGEFDHASGVRQVVDDRACREMVATFEKEAATPNFPGLLVDFDHFSHSSDKTSAAAGWIFALRAEPKIAAMENSETPSRAPGLWGRIRWSDLGDVAVRGGRYRLVSPVWNRSDCEAVEGGEADRVRPLRLARLALTNDPNLKGLVPLSNRQVPETGESSPESVSTMNYKTKLLELLGLKPEASDEEITAAAAAFSQEQEMLQQRYGALLATRVEDDLREFSAVIGDVDAVRGQLLANREGALQVLHALKASTELPQAKSPAVEVPAGRGAFEPLHNRATARVPEAVFSPEKLQADAARARRIANRAREIQKQLGVGHTQAFEMARGEV